jgi:hypothetical protein
MEALRRSKARKGREDCVKLLSLLFETFTLNELNQLFSATDIKISPTSRLEDGRTRNMGLN